MLQQEPARRLPRQLRIGRHIYSINVLHAGVCRQRHPKAALALLAVLRLHVAVDNADHDRIQLFRVQRRFGAHAPCLHVVGADARNDAARVHIRVNHDDLHTCIRCLVNRLRIFCVADGGKDNRIRAVCYRLADILVLRLIIFFCVRSQHGQVDVIFRLCRVRTREDRFPEFGRRRFCNQIHFIRTVIALHIGAARQSDSQKQRQKQRQHSSFHRLTPSAFWACAP